MQSQEKDKWFRYMTGFLLGAMALAGAIWILPKYQRFKELEARNVLLDEQIKAKRAEIREIKEYSIRFKSDREFVESLARKQQRVYPGEIMFVFEDK